MSPKNLVCDNCETEIVDGLGCDCGDYEPGFNRASYFVEKETGYKPEIE